ncbi:MAG TPA: immunoglobulin domain-containing protein, partial [Phycisphaerae bacterium]|nr:immunoglobulin domain-containing protein [Phycisphaerae bacterium]
SNTALPGLPNRSAVLAALTTASDHLPMVADYTLTISQAPVVTGQPGDQTVCSGGSASFSVSASGIPAPTFQWRRGVNNLSDGGNISGSQSPTLTISPAGSVDADTNYYCVATNTAGSVPSNNAMLAVFQGGSGDVNGDGFTDGGDVQAFLDAIFSGGPPSNSYCAADINQDGTSNTADVDGFVNLLLGL